MLFIPFFIPSSRKCCSKCDCDCDSLYKYTDFPSISTFDKVFFSILMIFIVSLAPSIFLLKDIFGNLSFYDDEIKLIYSISKKEPDFFEYLKENDFHKKGFNSPDKDSYNIDRIDILFFIEPTLKKSFNKYFLEYNASDLSDLYKKITPKPYFDNSDVTYFTKYLLSEKMNEFMISNGILSIYEYEILEAMVENSPIIQEEILFGLKKYRNHPIIEKLYRDYSFQGYIPKSSKKYAYSALEEVLKIEYSEMHNHNPNDHFKPAYNYQISSIDEYFEEYNNKRIYDFYKKYTSDNFLSYAEYIFISFLFREYESDLEEAKQAPDYIQNAAKYAIKNNFLSKSKIEEEIKNYGFIRNSFADSLVTVFILNQFKDGIDYPSDLSEYFEPIYQYQENIVSYMLEKCPILTQSIENFKAEKGYISEDNLSSLYDEEKEKCGTKY